jgi:glycosyltransferase involved in cell wall biosynthesis
LNCSSEINLKEVKRLPAVKNMPDVVQYLRRPLPNFHYSVEGTHAEICKRLKKHIKISEKRAPFYSKGILPRIFTVFDALFTRCRVFHVCGDITFAGCLAPKKRLVTTFLDFGFMKRNKGIARLLLKIFWLDIPANRSKYIILISETMKREFLELMSIEPHKISVIYPPVSNRFIHSPKEFPGSDHEILCIGTAPNKNLHRVIEACALISCTLHIMGHLDQEVLMLLGKYNIKYRNSVNLSQQEVIDSYVECDFLVFTSLYEGFGLPIIEAQKVGRPVITSQIDPMMEVAGSGALLVDPYDVQDIRRGISEIIENQALRQLLIDEGQKNATKFDPEYSAAQHLKIYRSMMKTQGNNFTTK